MVYLYYITIKNVRWAHVISVTSQPYYEIKKKGDTEQYIQSIYGKKKKTIRKMSLQNDGEENEEK